ncbi:MAG: hypothetical protein COX62_00310 [Deltaproteobacteria bacterium CG_4_10_14_0_2_um_filter_43_8]|nr:MAG: hypothetical protein COV43_03570 [Deltaproteobacteria bacterium CG11_big_fil_rev_8_21_14_0_20_42_23]PJA22266.1 MAG: hypothetical protein COX62_00310 [Deltaproteobacteria bacterium CG_4_10_14_0_2_um_filter_43_8]PJC63507.1 MAG: hypothetical protein CO021_09230 [Deltaproteobacteria bacterium CG_4_9_14_0_2_um_filter_42_21]
MLAIIASEGINLFPDETFFLQLCFFLFTLSFLNTLVFRPALRILRRRYELTEGSSLEAKKFTKKAEENEQKIHACIAEKRHAARLEGDEKRRVAEDTARKLLQKTREEIKLQVEKARVEIEREAAETEKNLEKEITTLEALILSRLTHKQREGLHS